ncbi:hypothetical protein ACF1DV_03380 [Streptomyces achromogenes]|uniref:hypothetical protein n=1 Tax=Streptomyces achromogenes TaxID=67255 RepID=UPI0036FF63BA
MIAVHFPGAAAHQPGSGAEFFGRYPELACPDRRERHGCHRHPALALDRVRRLLAERVR